MLSICIPIYNFDVRPLVQELYKQSQSMNFPVEIVCIDDHSDEEFDRMNREVEGCMSHYIRLEENVGRARIRNLFLVHTQYDYLLFLDCDSMVRKNNFMSRYADVLLVKPSVVCGGRTYPKISDRSHRLRYRYGVVCESKDAKHRQLRPNHSFMTNNFIIKRSLLENIRFDERLSRYGHEDTLFGYQLKEQNITILHIENPVENGDVETNACYLEKTRESIENLVEIYDWMQEDKGFYKEVNLLMGYEALRRTHTAGLVRVLCRPLVPLLEARFRRGFANMVLFRLYKLELFLIFKKNKVNSK